MKAVVMAGGFGSRLYPLTVGYPKPMIPLVNKPVLGHTFDLLKQHNFSEVVLTVRYLAHHIQDYFGDGRRFGLKIHYAVEDMPLGTAGGVKNAQRYLDHEAFLVMSGDALTDIDLSELIQFHRQKGALATLALKIVANPCQYGMVITDEDGRIEGYVEKPKFEQVTSKAINTGIYILEPQLLADLEPEAAYDFSYDVFPKLLNDNAPFFGKVINGYWRDIGTLRSYANASFDILAGRVRGINLGHHLGKHIWAGDNVEISPQATLRGPLYLGDGVKIDRDVNIYGPAVIGQRTVIDRHAYIEQAIIGSNCLIGPAVSVHHAIVPEQSILTAKSVVPKKLAPHLAGQPASSAPAQFTFS